MGRRILCEMVHGTEMFIVWSSIVDAPITYGMSKEELFEWTTDEEGRLGREQLERDFERARFDTVDDELVCNRAGADETRLTREQIIEFFFEHAAKANCRSGPTPATRMNEAISRHADAPT